MATHPAEEDRGLNAKGTYMKQRSIIEFLLFQVIITIAFSLIHSLDADTIYMRNGESIEGKIKSHKLNFIIVEVENGTERSLPKDAIRKISYGTVQHLNSNQKIVSRSIKKTEPPKADTESINSTVTDLTSESTQTEEQEPNLLKGFTPIIFEVTKDGRIYTIPVFGENFPANINVKLISENSEKKQKFRNLSDNSFTLLVDGDDMETGEYDLLIESEDGVFIQRIGRFVEIIDKPVLTEQNSKKP